MKRSGSADKFSAQLEISNPSEHRIMFRMRTTNPSRYQVTPRTGIIDSVSVVNTQSACPSRGATRVVTRPWRFLTRRLRPCASA